VRFSGGCNLCYGTYETDNAALVISERLTTQMGCTEDQALQDEWFAEFFRGHPSIEVDGSRVYLKHGSTVLTYIEQ